MVNPDLAIAAKVNTAEETGWLRASRLVPALIALAVLTAGVIWIRPSRPAERAATLPLMKTIQFTSMTSNEFGPAISPDEKLIAFSRHDGVQEEIYVKQIGAGEALQLTHSPIGRNGDAAWSPDGLHIAFLRKGQRFERQWNLHYHCFGRTGAQTILVGKA